MAPLRVLLVGLGHMGMAHGRAYDSLEGYEIAGLCARSIHSRMDLPDHWRPIPRFPDYYEALAAVRPDVVSINTWPDTHAAFAVAAFEAGAHVFIEKPLAETAEDAERVLAAARQHDRKLVVGYSMRHNPIWKRVVELAQGLGKPLVMRMNLNQQSIGPSWTWHKNLLSALSPIVDCGVHYVDAMCQMTLARPVRVSGMGARLSEEIATDQYNYGQLQVFFDDGSIGWYEAAWGPSISEIAFMVKDIMGPKGSISVIPPAHQLGTAKGATWTFSSDIHTHGRMESVLLHHSALNPDQSTVEGDEIIPVVDKPDHDQICRLEQIYLLDAINGKVDLGEHMEAAVNSLKIVLAADLSIKEKRVVEL
ncbi:Gfo/Idh/MocA family protein [Labrys okinawensis]|uniref:Gfo/Idh/MocA family protein n=1 Tax=Labrys okinawensis TaxID=346911 RepID=UPI0039BD8CCE